MDGHTDRWTQDGRTTQKNNGRGAIALKNKIFILDRYISGTDG